MNTEIQRGPGRPPRLERVFQKYDSPLYFVTFCTEKRRMILAGKIVHHAFVDFCTGGYDRKGIAVGRYVIMPDHIHLFVGLSPSDTLEQFVRQLKRTLSVALQVKHASPFWQRGFFDHMLRSNESYSEKWEYVRMNPLRAGLVNNPNDWPYQGELVQIDRI